MKAPRRPLDIPSNHELVEFMALLNQYGIQRLIDIRSLPGSRKVPHFDKEVLPGSRAEALQFGTLQFKEGAIPERFPLLCPIHKPAAAAQN